MKELSNRTATFTDSVIRRMTRISNKYGAVNLSQGFPDFDPPSAAAQQSEHHRHRPQAALPPVLHHLGLPGHA